MIGKCYMCEEETELSDYYGHGAMMCTPCIDYADDIQSAKPVDYKTVKCKRCSKNGEDGEVLFSEDGYIDRIVGGWYWSDNDECWYCRPCESKLVSESLSELFSLAKEKKIKVMDFQGNDLLEDE